ncbi:MAG: hypothetical protein ACXVWV_00285 [Nocardioides sp.]
MIAWSTAPAAGALAHGIHYALVAGGLVGLTLLLVPSLGHRPGRAATPGRSEHERRIRALHQDLLALRVAQESTGAVPLRRLTGVLPDAVRPAASTSYVALPLAVVSTAAAAGVHAAVCPDHLRESVVLGLFFGVAALAQLAWAGLALRGSTPALVRAGLVGNAAVVLLWLTTRVLGLPLGLLPAPESVGPWDVAATLWELVAVGACLDLLRHHRGAARSAPWSRWPVPVRAFFAVSVVLLGALSISGAGS